MQNTKDKLARKLKIMKIRYYMALWMAKLSILALKITKHAGTNFPGIVALKICPQFLKYAAKPEKIVAITGTNGKTTVSNMILDMLSMDGYDVLNNKAGSNINSGIASSLIYGMSITGKCKHEIGVFEVDERSALRVFPYLIPDYMLVTNLSRDSIMRNGHPEYIAGILNRYIPGSTRLVLNADDLICSALAPDNSRKYFGIEAMDGDIRECKNLINDMRICPKCNNKLEYEYLRYNHIGKAYCPSCDFKAPEYDYAGCNADIKNMCIDVKDAGGKGHYKLLNDSVFNIYNVVSAVALLREMGYTHEQIEGFFEKLNIVGTRFDEQRIGSRTLYKLLAKEKNAFATSRVFDYISTLPGDKEIILMNSCQGDMKHWSENTCWLYDCDFEFLNDESIKNIVICGPRRLDHKLRLLLAGVSEERISFSEKEIDAPDQLRLFENDNVFVLYGTDSIALGKKVAEAVKNKMRAAEGGAK